MQLGQATAQSPSSLSVQKEPASVIDSRKATTYRLYQSMVAASYMDPAAIDSDEIAVLQTWSGRSKRTARIAASPALPLLTA